MRTGPSIQYFATAYSGGAGGRDRCFLFVPGILSDADNNFAWHAAAARSVRRLSGGQFDGEAFDYELELIPGVPIRWMPKMQRKVRELAEVLLEFHDCELHVAVHSNGGNMICEALRLLLKMGGSELHGLHLTSLHLIAPSCESDCRKNLLNEAVLLDLVSQVFLYQPGRDGAVRLGHAMKFLFGWAGLGHGNLSVAGFRHVADGVQGRFHTLQFPEANHTSLLSKTALEHTLKTILSNADAAGNEPK